MSNASRKLLCTGLSLVLFSCSLLAAAKSQVEVAVLSTSATSIDVEARLALLRRKLSIAVLAQVDNPDAANATLQPLRSQGLALWAAAPNGQQRSLVLEQMQQWGLLSQLPGWDPRVALPQLALPRLPPAPDKAWLEANVDFDNLRQPLVVHFWALWCGPCRKELPHLARFYAEQYLALQAAGLELVTVNNDPVYDPTYVLANTKDMPASFQQLPVLQDPEFRLYRQLAQTHDVALPATFLLQPGQPHRVLAYGPMQWLAPGVIQELQTLVHRR